MRAGPAPDEHDRTVVTVCAVLALGVALGLPLVGFVLGPRLFLDDPTHLVGLLSAVLGQVPVAAALTAVVLTRLPLVGVGIAVAASIAGGVVGVTSMVVRDWEPQAVLPGWVGTVVVAGLLVVADLVARRVRRFDLRSGALTGLAVAVLLVAGHYLLLLLLAGTTIDQEVLARALLAGELPLRAVVLTLTGAVAGWFVARPQAGGAAGTAAR
jgi:hypothetical protein